MLLQLATTGLAGILGLSTASASSFSYSEDFTGPNGTQPADWQILMGDGAINNNRYEDDTSGQLVAIHDTDESSNWGDYTISAGVGSPTWSDFTTTWGAVVARVQNSEQWYGVRITGNQGTYGGAIQLIKGLPGNGISIFDASTSTGTFNANDAWKLELSVDTREDGVHLSATWYRPSDGLDSPFVASAVDSFANPSHGVAPYLSGPGGIASVSGGKTYFWDDLEVSGSLIPEPGSMALLSLGAVALMRRRRLA